MKDVGSVRPTNDGKPCSLSSRGEVPKGVVDRQTAGTAGSDSAPVVRGREIPSVGPGNRGDTTTLPQDAASDAVARIFRGRQTTPHVESAGERVSPDALVKIMRHLDFARVHFEKAFRRLDVLAPHMDAFRLDVLANTNEKPADQGLHTWRRLHDLVRGSAKRTRGLLGYLQEVKKPSPALQFVVAVAEDIYKSGLAYLNASNVATKNNRAQIEALAATEYPYSAQRQRLAIQAVLEGDGRERSGIKSVIAARDKFQAFLHSPLTQFTEYNAITPELTGKERQEAFDLARQVAVWSFVGDRGFFGLKNAGIDRELGHVFEVAENAAHTLSAMMAKLEQSPYHAGRYGIETSAIQSAVEPYVSSMACIGLACNVFDAYNDVKGNSHKKGITYLKRALSALQAVGGVHIEPVARYNTDIALLMTSIALGLPEGSSQQTRCYQVTRQLAALDDRRDGRDHQELQKLLLGSEMNKIIKDLRASVNGEQREGIEPIFFHHVGKGIKGIYKAMNQAINVIETSLSQPETIQIRPHAQDRLGLMGDAAQALEQLPDVNLGEKDRERFYANLARAQAAFEKRNPSPALKDRERDRARELANTANRLLGFSFRTNASQE